jgi:hypothetical protein
MRNRDLSDGDFGEIARGLLTAIRFDVETLVADQTGFYINVSLLVEDWEDEEKLRVVARANPSRINRSYFKRDLFVATAMEEQKVRFESNFAQAGKPYRSILAIPMILEGEASLQTIGVISIDSGRRGEFYQEVAINLEQRLSPYVNLLGLLLVMQAELRKDELDGPVA